jgi:arsenate reductase
MGEAFANKYGEGKITAESAGLEPGSLNSIVVEAMKEVGVDISKNKTKSVFDFYKQGRLYNYVITMCDEAAKEKCPIFPGNAVYLHWSFPDPGSFSGSHEEKLAKVRVVRDSIEEKIKKFINYLNN